MSYPRTFRELFLRTGYHDTERWHLTDDDGVLVIHHGAHSWRMGMADAPPCQCPSCGRPLHPAGREGERLAGAHAVLTEARYCCLQRATLEVNDGVCITRAPTADDPAAWALSWNAGLYADAFIAVHFCPWCGQRFEAA